MDRRVVLLETAFANSGAYGSWTRSHTVVATYLGGVPLETLPLWLLSRMPVCAYHDVRRATCV